jgi:hypothetical protein
MALSLRELPKLSHSARLKSICFTERNWIEGKQKGRSEKLRPTFSLAIAERSTEYNPGGDLRSHTVARAVSSAQRGLTTVFGMGTGVTLAI